MMEKAQGDGHLVAECAIMFEKVAQAISEFNTVKDDVILFYNAHQRESKFKQEASEAIENLIKATSFSQEFSFTEKLWLCGEKNGKVTGTFRMLNFPFLQQMSLLKIRNDGISMSSKQNLVETSSKLGRPSKLNTDKYARLVNLSNKLIAHNRSQKRLDFFVLQEVIADLGAWLDTKEH